jgi:integrase
MALHTRNVIKRMFEYAIARQLVPSNPATAIVARFIATQDSRTRVLDPDEIGRVLRAVYARASADRSSLRFTCWVLSMVRKSELIEARWSEFDLDAGIWRIPANRMKKDREHWCISRSRRSPCSRNCMRAARVKRCANARSKGDSHIDTVFRSVALHGLTASFIGGWLTP